MVVVVVSTMLVVVKMGTRVMVVNGGKPHLQHRTVRLVSALLLLQLHRELLQPAPEPGRAGRLGCMVQSALVMNSI